MPIGKHGYAGETVLAQPRREQRKKGQPAPWFALVRTEWSWRFPGCQPPVMAVKQLRPVYEALSWEEATARLKRYLHSTPSQFLNLAKFAMTHADYAEDSGLHRARPLVKTVYQNGKPVVERSGAERIGTILTGVPGRITVGERSHRTPSEPEVPVSTTGGTSSGPVSQPSDMLTEPLTDLPDWRGVFQQALAGKR